MSTRSRHPDKDIERFLRRLEVEADWRIERGSKYFKAYCGGGCRQHKCTFHLSPSDPNYLKNRIAWLRRETCWEGDR